MFQQDEVIGALLELAIPGHRDIEKAFEVVKLFCLLSDFLRLDEVRVDRTWGIFTWRAGKLYKARSRLYRSQILQENTRWKALAEIYTMHSFAPFWNRIPKNEFSNLNFFR